MSINMAQNENSDWLHHKLKTKRNRSKVLDHNVIRARLNDKNIHSLDEFESAYCKFYGLGNRGAGTPHRAWYGKQLDNKNAQDVACFLGVNHYTELMTYSATMWWDELIADAVNQAGVFDIEYDNDDEWR